MVSFIGYRSDTLTVRAEDNYVEVVLKSGQELDEVNVVKRGPGTIINTRSPLIEQVITGEELCRAACCNLGESFTTNASVDVSYADAVTGAKQIQLLGLNGKYVQMILYKPDLAVCVMVYHIPAPDIIYLMKSSSVIIGTPVPGTGVVTISQYRCLHLPAPPSITCKY